MNVGLSAWGKFTCQAVGHHVFDSSCRWGPFKETYLAEHSEDCHVVTKHQARYMASYCRHRTPSIQMHPGEQHQSTQHRPTFIGIHWTLSYKTCRSTVSNPLKSPPVQLCQVGILAAQLLHLAWTNQIWWAQPGAGSGWCEGHSPWIGTKMIYARLWSCFQSKQGPYRKGYDFVWVSPMYHIPEVIIYQLNPHISSWKPCTFLITVTSSTLQVP